MDITRRKRKVIAIIIKLYINSGKSLRTKMNQKLYGITKIFPRVLLILMKSSAGASNCSLTVHHFAIYNCIRENHNKNMITFKSLMMMGNVARSNHLDWSLLRKKLKIRLSIAIKK